MNDRRVEYEYDYQEPDDFGSANNRLVKSELKVDSTGALISETFYWYTNAGNVELVGTRLDGETTLTGTKFVYAINERTVSYAMGVEWSGESIDCAGSGIIHWAREFRYDTGRQRYYSAELDRALLQDEESIAYEVSHAWTDYDGDEPYGDFTVTGHTVTELRSWEPGIASVDPWVGSGDANTKYFGMNHLGTTRMMTDSTGAADDRAVYTAFGERIAGPNHRYGYVGAWGYQAPASEDGADPYVTGFPYLHVGARYYDPSSGRFLQRDPIGLAGDLNVYRYTSNRPTNRIDPRGLDDVTMYHDNQWFRDNKQGIYADPPAVQTPEQMEGERDLNNYFAFLAGLCIGGLGLL